jgi:hypothetical protein
MVSCKFVATTAREALTARFHTPLLHGFPYRYGSPSRKSRDKTRFYQDLRRGPDVAPLLIAYASDRAREKLQLMQRTANVAHLSPLAKPLDATRHGRAQILKMEEGGASQPSSTQTRTERTLILGCSDVWPLLVIDCSRHGAEASSRSEPLSNVDSLGDRRSVAKRINVNRKAGGKHGRKKRD